MTARVDQLFAQSSRSLLSIFFTAGFPERDSTVPICIALEQAGVDFVEIGIPFSDPIADGPVIQRSSAAALANGITVSQIIAQVAEIRKECSLPIFLMGYLNPILQYGVEKFLDQIALAGADGVILPDLPLIDYETKYQTFFLERELSNTFLITPQTPEARVRKLDRLSTGFLYVVSSPTITGSLLDVSEQRDQYLQRIKDYKLRNPLVVGFGISRYADVEAVSNYVSGVIVGTAFIKHLNEHGVQANTIRDFIQQLKGI